MSPSSSLGDSIFDTAVSWRDVEERLQEDLNTKAILGPRRSAKLIGEGNLQVERGIRLICPYEVVKIKYGAMVFRIRGECSLSEIVIKIVSQVAGQEVGDSLKDRGDDSDVLVTIREEARKLHNREVNCYRVFSRFDLSILKIPQLYFAQAYTDSNKLKAFIGMEYVDGVELRHIFHNVAVEEILDALRALAYLEAVSLQLNDEERQWIASSPIVPIYGSLLPPGAVKKTLLEFGSRSEAYRASCKELSEMSSDLGDMKLASSLNEELGMKDVMVHGDLWSANLMWKKTTKGFELGRIIDFQMAHFGCAAEDLCRLLSTTLSGKDRRQHWERLLETFHEYLKGFCKDPLPYTLDQLKESYRRFFPLAGTLLLPVIDAIAQIGSRNVPNEEKAEAQRTLTEKTQALFEDMLYYAKRNRDIRTPVKP